MASDYGPIGSNAAPSGSGGKSGKGGASFPTVPKNMDEYGPHGANVQTGGGRIDKAMKWSSTTDKPSLDLVNTPDAAMRKIRSMKFTSNASWKSDVGSAMRSAK